MGADESLGRLYHEVTERARRLLGSDRYAADLAILGYPLGLIVPEFLEDFAFPALDLALERVGGERLAGSFDEAVEILATYTVETVLDLLRRLKPLMPPASEG